MLAILAMTHTMYLRHSPFPPSPPPFPPQVGVAAGAGGQCADRGPVRVCARQAQCHTPGGSRPHRHRRPQGIHDSLSCSYGSGILLPTCWEAGLRSPLMRFYTNTLFGSLKEKEVSPLVHMSMSNLW
jgi:hypothetical protein